MRKASFVLLALLPALAAPAGELEGVKLPDQVTVSGRNLVLNGLGVREATVLMVNVYVAGLYLEAKSSDPAAILDPGQPKQIVMKFVRSVGKEKLTEAFTEPHRELGIDMPLDALVSLVMTFNIGIMVERLGDIETGHRELLDWIDQWLSS
jgi:hypothetical protein